MNDLRSRKAHQGVRKRKRPPHFWGASVLLISAMRLGQVRVEALAGPSLRSVLHLTGPVGKDIQTPPLFASNQDEQKQLESEGPPMNRREALIRTIALPSAAALAGTVAVQPVSAGQPVIDSTSGELFTPKAAMLGGGGSDAARGIKIQSRDRSKLTRQNRRTFEASSVGPIQPVYNTRFVTYLSRFILNFDPAARSWWLEQIRQLGQEPTGEGSEELRFAEFAESVEVGLADYFVGPYGSYSSLAAAKAGIGAGAPATSAGITYETSTFDIWKKLGVRGKEKNVYTANKTRKQLAMSIVKQKRQGILNLFTLLKARYTSLGAKKQLAILFSFIDDPALQPKTSIRGILGEVDNAAISTISIGELSFEDDDNFRQSSRRGGGYAAGEIPAVYAEPPPALGQQYYEASLIANMDITSRVLRIRVVDGGEGYTTLPTVTVSQNGAKRPCEAVAVLDRTGTVESVLVLDPGFGFGGFNGGRTNRKKGPVAPLVEIAPPKSPKAKGNANAVNRRQAKAVAELEYGVSSISIVDPGSGFAFSQPPKITISPCEEDPEWYVAPMTASKKLATTSATSAREEFLTANVASMKVEYVNAIVDTSSAESIQAQFDTADVLAIERARENSIALLPQTVRPFPMIDSEKGTMYQVPNLPPLPEQPVALPSQKYRAIDPIFGGVGAKPVTIGAKNLTADEYTRLALSGAICTVLVRTGLNPLELVKTKIQLGNDKELMDFAAKGGAAKEKTGGNNANANNDAAANIGTADLISSLVKLRGPLALFQSADITFLASLVFGSFGFGATELFRRSFSNIFFSEGGGGGVGGEFVLLGAAGLATVLTSFAASPFEIIRVQSMGKVEAQSWTTVLGRFLADKRSSREGALQQSNPREVFKKWFGGKRAAPPPTSGAEAEFSLTDISKDDLAPLFSGFTPILSRELPFAVTKFLVFDILAKALIALINSNQSAFGLSEAAQVGVGTTGLGVSAAAGAVAGIVGAVISHPADLILTLTSAAANDESGRGAKKEGSSDWRPIVKDLLEKDGGIVNLFTGLPARATFFFLVIGLQFFLYDAVKGLFEVSSDDLTLVLDVFYAIRQGLISMDASV